MIDEFGRRFLVDVFVPAVQRPKGLPRLDAIVQRWIVRTRDVEAHTGCVYSAGVFELHDCEGPLRYHLHGEITRWRAALRRTIVQAVERGDLRSDTAAERLVAEIYALMLGLIHDTRFLRAPAPPNVRRPVGSGWSKVTSHEFCQPHQGFLLAHISHDRAKKGKCHVVPPACPCRGCSGPRRAICPRIAALLAAQQ